LITTAPHQPLFDAVENFHQPENGYRFSTDSILLADFVRAEGLARLADFGAGCGVVGLCALEKGRAPQARHFFFVEQGADFQDSLAKNAALYQKRTTAKLHILHSDWRDVTPDDFGGPLDYVMVNPPYFTLHSGRPSRHPSADAARRERHGSLAELLQTLARLLAPGGRAAVMLPAARRDELLKLLQDNGFSVERLEIIYSAPGGRARLALAEARLGAAAR
jgi:tRNA1Val (adenine37-N6)-methyltransferase